MTTGANHDGNAATQRLSVIGSTMSAALPPAIGTEWRLDMATTDSLAELSVADVMAGLTRWPAYRSDPWVRAAVDLLHAHNGYGHWLADRKFLGRCVRRGVGDPAMLVIDWAAAGEAADELIGTRSETAVLKFAVSLATDEYAITSLDTSNRAALVAALTTATRSR